MAPPNAALEAIPVSFFSDFSTDVHHMNAQTVILQAEYQASEAFCDRGIAKPTPVGTLTTGRLLFEHNFAPISPRQNTSLRLARGLIRQRGQTTTELDEALPSVPEDMVVRSGLQFP
jgi:hypothetical protein